MESLPEQELLLRFGRGEPSEREAAFAELHRRLAPGLFSLCRRIVGDPSGAEDALQETFLALHRALPRFRGEARLFTWAYRVALRVAHRHRARQERSRHESLVSEPGVDDASRVEEAELGDALDRAISSLRPVYREVFSLCCVEGLSRGDVAQILGIPEGTVWTHLHRARKELTRLLGPFLRPEPQ